MANELYKNICLISIKEGLHGIELFVSSWCAKKTRFPWGGGRGCFPYNGRYGEAPPERGTFFRFQVYESEGISLVEVYERVGKSVIWDCERPKEPNR